MTAGSLELSFQILIGAISQVQPEFGLDQTPVMQERGKYAENS